MAKKVIAVITIIHNGETIKPGEDLPFEKFTKDQLTRLYERGAVRVELGEAAPEPVAEKVETEEVKVETEPSTETKE